MQGSKDRSGSQTHPVREYHTLVAKYCRANYHHYRTEQPLVKCRKGSNFGGPKLANPRQDRHFYFQLR